MKRLLRQSRHGQRGFTLIELLIVVAILGILAAVLVPNLATFLGTGKVAAANTEAANVETAALAYYADNDGKWPDDSADLYDGDDLANSYLSEQPKAIYDFDPVSGQISSATTDANGWGTDIHWDEAKEQWVKGAPTG